MSDIARPYPKDATPGGFAADGRPENARPYPNGKELGVTAKGDDKAHGGQDLAK